MKRILAVSVVLLISGCGFNPGIVQVAPDTYLLCKTDKAGVFGNLSKFKANVISEANAFAQAQGKVAIPVSVNETPNYPFHCATIDYQFRVVDPTSPEAKGAVLGNTPTVVIESDQKLNIKTEEIKKQDIYSELIKLDDLRKKGIINDAEFETQKKKLISDK